MKKVLLLSLIALLGAMQMQAQQQNKCSVDAAAGALIKQRLLDNRQLFTKQEIKALVTNRVITYIPLTIHNVENTSGEGATPISTILGFICGLNAIYLDQDIQFFMHSPIRTLVSNNIDNNVTTFSSGLQMATQKVANTINIYIGRSLNAPNASFYSPQGDYLFFLNIMLSNAAKTEAHEIGHFFSLNHTFYGWEGIDVEATYGGGSVPGSVGGSSTERAPRSGSQSNCHFAADGFCDTEADYYSDRKSCPYVPTVTDPAGNAIDPDESNIMSYADDACVNNFSTEQKAAIAIDVAARSWVSNTPSSTANVTGITTVISPLDGTTLGSISNPTVRLEWTPVTGATWYYLEVYGTNFPGLWLVNTSDVIYRGLVTSGNTFYDLPTAGLTANARYAWRIKAVNQYSTCAGISPFTKFQAVTTVTTDIKDLPIEQQMTLKVNSNPITTTDIPLTIYAAEDLIGSIRVYSMDGREVISADKQQLNQGESLVQLPADNMPNGVYTVVLFTERGQLQQKIIIQR